MNPGEFKLAIHGGLWPICEVLENLKDPWPCGFEMFKDGSGDLAGKLFNNIDELIELLTAAKQEEANK